MVVFVGEVGGRWSKAKESFVRALKKPAAVIILVKAGAPVDATLEDLAKVMEPGDLLIDGGNEWYENTERRAAALAEEKSLLYLGMGVSGGEEGARKGPSMMPGGSLEAYKRVEPILEKVAAQVEGPCVTYVGDGGAGNFVKMVHNGIEYGIMAALAEGAQSSQDEKGASASSLRREVKTLSTPTLITTLI